MVHWFSVVHYYLNNENCHDNDNFNKTYLDNRIIAHHYHKVLLRNQLEVASITR